MKRKMKKTLKQAVACTIASTVLLASPAYAQMAQVAEKASAGSVQTLASAPRTGFPDVAATHWAIKHISKLAAQGIVEGDDLGRFSPESPVSQQDAIIMAIRMMGLQEEVLANKSSISLPLTTRDDARPYVAYAFEKGLLDLEEEVKSGNNNWGSRSATREWVATVVIRAIGKKQDAMALSNKATSFKDNKDISAQALGYINESVELGIVNGFDDNTFQPKANVTRAQIATFFSRADAFLEVPNERVIEGTILAIEGSTLTLQDKNGRSQVVELDATASYYTAKDDTTKLKLSDLKPYNEVYVLAYQGRGYFVEVTGEVAPMETFEGTLVSIDLDYLKITLDRNGQQVTYDMSSNMYIVDQNGAGSSLSSLVPDSTVELKRSANVQNAKVTQLTVKKLPVNKTVEGSFQSVDVQAMTIQVKDRTTGLIDTYPITDLSAFTQGDQYFDPNNLFEGDVVRLDVKNGKVIGVQVIQQLVQKRDKGKLYELSSDRTLITLAKESNEYAAYLLADNVNVIIEGNAYSTVKDLMPGDDMTVEVNDNKVIRIRVSSRSVQNYALATIVSYDADKKWLTVSDESGKPQTLELTDKTRILFDNSDIPLANFSSIFTKGKRVNLVASKTSLISIQIATRAEGTITQINPTSGDIMIKSANGVVQSYRINAYTAVDKLGAANAKLADLRVGDVVRAAFDQNQEQVYSISVRTNGVFHTVSKDENAQSIVVRDLNGTTYTYSLRDIPVSRGANAARVSDIVVGEPLKLSFMGKTLEAIEVVSAVRGQVTSVDSQANRLVLMDYTNTPRTIEVKAPLTIHNGSVTDSNLFAVKQDHRVEVITDGAGGTTILVIPGTQRVVESYNPSTQTLSLKRRTTTDQTEYKVHDRAFIHQGTNLLAPTSLKTNDSVTIYMLNDTIVEISK